MRRENGLSDIDQELSMMRSISEKTELIIEEPPMQMIQEAQTGTGLSSIMTEIFRHGNTRCLR